jgi:hypothetical protein
MIKAYSTLRKAERDAGRIEILGWCMNWGTDYLIWQDNRRCETNHTQLEDIPMGRLTALRKAGYIR